MNDIDETFLEEKRRLETRLALINELLGVSKVKKTVNSSKGRRYSPDFGKMELPATFTSTQYRDCLGYKISAPTLANQLKKLELTKIIRKMKPAKGRSPAIYVKLRTLLGHGPVSTKTKVHSKRN